MKKITMFLMASCPYCKEALRWMDALAAGDDRYKAIEIEKIDERLQPAIANQ